MVEQAFWFLLVWFFCMSSLLKGGTLAWECSSVRRCACESPHEVTHKLNYLRPLKTVARVRAARSAGGLVPRPRTPALGRAWQDGHAWHEPHETARALREYVNPSTPSPLQRIRKGGAFSGLARSKETCLRAEAVPPGWAGGALRERFLQSSASRVLISGCLLLYVLAPSWFMSECPPRAVPRVSGGGGSLLPFYWKTEKARDVLTAAAVKFCENMLQPYLKFLLLVVVDIWDYALSLRDSGYFVRIVKCKYLAIVSYPSSQSPTGIDDARLLYCV